MTENKQEIINSGYYVLKEVNLLHGNDGIVAKYTLTFIHFSFPFFYDFELRFTMVEGGKFLKKVWCCVGERV